MCRDTIAATAAAGAAAAGRRPAGVAVCLTRLCAARSSSSDSKAGKKRERRKGEEERRKAVVSSDDENDNTGECGHVRWGLRVCRTAESWLDSYNSRMTGSHESLRNLLKLNVHNMIDNIFRNLKCGAGQHVQFASST